MARTPYSLGKLPVLVALSIAVACGRTEGLDVDDTAADDPSANSSGSDRGTGGGASAARTERDGAVSGGSANGGAFSDGASTEDIAPEPVPITWKAAPALCTGLTGPLDSASVWSDHRGVFVLAALGSSEIFANRGSGWELIAKAYLATADTRLSGFVDGPLIRYGDRVCSVHLVAEDGTDTCSMAADATDVFAVNSDLAYAINVSYSAVYDGNYWKDYVRDMSAFESDVGSLSLHSIWANQDFALIGADHGLLFRVHAAEPETLQPDKDALQSRFRSVWAFGENDLWAGRSDGVLLHYVANEWQKTFEGATGCNGRGIEQLWGYDGFVVFASDSAVWATHDGSVDQIFEASCDSTVKVASIWGNSPKELFVALIDADSARSDCGQARVLRYDGATTHEL